MFLPHPHVNLSIVGSLRDREVACSSSDRQGSNFVSCVWRTASSYSSHHPQEVILAQFNLYAHKGGLKPDLFHLIMYTSSERSVKVSREHYFTRQGRNLVACIALFAYPGKSTFFKMAVIERDLDHKVQTILINCNDIAADELSKRSCS